MTHRFGPRTHLIHGNAGCGHGEFRSHAFPIFQTSAFIFNNMEESEQIFAGTAQHDAYSRISSPNHRFLEERLCILEKGEAAQVFDSGMTAIRVALMSLLVPGNEIIAHRNLYGGTVGLLKELGRFGIITNYFDTRQTLKLLKTLTPRTKIIFLETPSNPLLDICDFETIKALLVVTAKRNDVLVLVDNTFATPCNQNPLARGADISIHSLTKYINGFGNAVGGAVVTSSNIMERIWRSHNGSGMLDPEVAQRIAVNMMSLPDRMKRHNKNGLIISGFLNNHPLVSRTYYPGLPEHPNHHVAKRLMTGFGGMISFELNDKDSVKTKTFLNKLAQDRKDGNGIITLSVSLGCVDTLICCPALSTHYNLSAEERLKQDISNNLIRLSVGTEDVEDIIYSLERGFQAIV